MLLTDLIAIDKAAIKNEQENEKFKTFLKQKDADEIDALVLKLNEKITPQIDCTICGNCCKSLMVNVEDSDAERLSLHLQLEKETFYETYVERSSQGSLAVMNKIPCHFLYDNKCTVYEARPAECREFPGLHNAGFTKRLFAIFMHYGRCPIIYNVVEEMKKTLQHSPAQ